MMKKGFTSNKNEDHVVMAKDPNPTSTSSTGSENGFVMKLSVIASMSGLLFGYDTGVVSGSIIFCRGYMDLSDLQVEVVVASTILSAAISAAFGHHLLDKKGRKGTLVISSTIFIIGSILMACAFGPNKGYPALVAGRIVVGVAIGLASDAGPLYISECAPPKLRGSLTTLFNVAVVGGQVFASIICGCLSYLPPSYNWRLMLGFGAVPALVQMAGFMLLPLSPTWLVMQGRAKEAEAVLRKIRTGSSTDKSFVELSTMKKDDDSPTGTSSHPRADSLSDPCTAEDEAEQQRDLVTDELSEIIVECQAAMKGEHVRLAELWRSFPHIRRAMILGCSLWAVSQLAGINTIMYYGASIVRRSGLGGDKSFDIWITVPLNTMQLIGIAVCYAIIDRKGRRTTLLLSMTFVWIGLFLIGLGFAMDSPITTVLAMCLYLFSFGVGLSTMPYTMNCEIYPVEYRGLCVAQATGVFWFTNFIVSVTFLTLSHLLGNAGVFFLYTAIVFVSEICFYIWVPETSGLSLPQIQALFAEEKEYHQPSPVSDHDDYGSTQGLDRGNGTKLPPNDVLNDSLPSKFEIV
jgi:MFS family permease